MIYFHIIKFYKWIDDISIEFDVILCIDLKI